MPETVMVIFCWCIPRQRRAICADKYGLYRENLMYNDFVIIGPEEDSTMIADAITVDEALARIADNNVIFVSRGDDSGTHKAEYGSGSVLTWNPIP